MVATLLMVFDLIIFMLNKYPTQIRSDQVLSVLEGSWMIKGTQHAELMSYGSKHFQNVLLVEIYSKSIVGAMGNVLHMKFS